MLAIEATIAGSPVDGDTPCDVDAGSVPVHVSFRLPTPYGNAAGAVDAEVLMPPDTAVKISLPLVAVADVLANEFSELQRATRRVGVSELLSATLIGRQ
jgi:hypothetical protein